MRSKRIQKEPKSSKKAFEGKKSKFTDDPDVPDETQILPKKIHRTRG